MSTPKSNDYTIIKALVGMCILVYSIAFFQNKIFSIIACIPLLVCVYYIAREVYRDIKSQFNNAWPVDLAAVKFITWASTM